METNFHIAVRFLLAKKRAMLMSLSGIIFGVGLFIVTQAQTSGFENFYTHTALATDGAIHVEDRFQYTDDPMTVRSASGKSSKISLAKQRRYIPGVQYPDEMMNALRKFENINGISPVLRGNVEADSNFRVIPAQIFGIDLDEFLAVSNLGHQVISGDIEDFRNDPNGVVIGSLLAGRLNLEVGDPVVLTQAGRSDRFRVSAIFETGVSDIDKERVIAHLPQARAILAQPFAVTYLQASLRDPDRAVADADQMQEVLGQIVVPWQEREKIWLGVFAALRFSSALTVSTIILISGLGMFNTLAMIVLEKTREIAILRSMGYTRRDISQIFLLQGTLVLFAGCVLGCAFGALCTWLVSTIPMPIRGIFSTDHFVVLWSPWHYVWALIAATFVVLIASWIPARRAARLEPGDIIRSAA